MKPVDLDELERLHAAATPGPWEHHRPLDDRAYISRFETEDGDPKPVATFGEWKSSKDNAALIAALRNAFPAMRDELRGRRKQVEVARRALSRIECIKNKCKGGDWDEIEIARGTASATLAALAALESGDGSHETD